MRALIVVIPIEDDLPIKGIQDVTFHMELADIKKAAVIGEMVDAHSIMAYKNRFGSNGLYDLVGALRSVINQ